MSDGTSASWQCKRYDKLTPADVRAAVKACTFMADRHHLVFSGEASSDVRKEIAKHSNWELLDRRGLGRMLDDLPLHKRRDVLDKTWGVQVRKLLLEVPGEDAFLSLDTFAADRMRPDLVLNDVGARVGREAERAAISRALDRACVGPIAVLVTGPGGRGKTRLLVEALTDFQVANPQASVVWLSPGRAIDSAALAELPQTPAVVVVDDAHHDPAAIAPLLLYARTVSGTQLILASRPSGTRALRAAVMNARYSMSDLIEVEVGELKIAQARALVRSVADGLDLVDAALEYFTQQATHSPHVAVIAANLIRREELTTPVKVDMGLREQVLARYEEVATGEVDGVPPVTVRRLLATYAALGPIVDDDVRPVIAEFCGLTSGEMLRLRQSLHDRGVLLTCGGATRVVPDVLADDVLEREAAVGPDATGFAEQLWAAFGGTHAGQLVSSLGDLDWRLTQQGGPAVFGPIWESVRAELRAAAYDGLCNALDRFNTLTATQPHALIEVLDEIRANLDDPAGRTDSGRAPTESRSDSPDAPTAEEALAWLRRIRTADDVRQRMPDLYGRCAVTAPDLLETALDALWDLRLRDTRPTNPHPAHPERVILDSLATIGILPDESFPVRIVTWVKRRLGMSSHEHEDAATPLIILGQLLKKDGALNSFKAPNTVVFEPFAVSVIWAQPIRDDIRAVLREHASGLDLRRAAVAVGLLGEALGQPFGAYGRSVSDAEILAWESDDLATIDVLRHVAEATTSPVIRRLVRHVLGWTADHGTSIPLRHAALTLATALDEREDDELVELLLHPDGYGVSTRRGVPVPSVAELRATVIAQTECELGMSDEQRREAQMAQIGRDLERERSEHDNRLRQIVAALTASGDPAHVVTVLDGSCRGILTVKPDHHVMLWSMWRHLGVDYPDLVPGIVAEIAANDAGPLDGFDQLLDSWAAHNEDALIDWLTGIERQRREVRLTVAEAFVKYDWTDRGSRFIDIHSRGTRDNDAGVRDRFLMGSARLLVAEPEGTVAELLGGGISPYAAAQVLGQACHHDGSAWGRQLNEEDAMAVLRLVDRAGWKKHTVQAIVSGIASAHPRLVLDHLLAARQAGARHTDEVRGLTAAFDEHAEIVTAWLVEQARHCGSAAEAASVASLVLHDGIKASQAEQLAAVLDDLSGMELLTLVTLFKQVRTWPFQQPALARRMLETAQRLGADTATEARAQITAAMHLQSWGGWNGQSPELERARATAASLATSETDPELREDFETIRDYYEDTAISFRQRHAEDGEE